VVDVEVGIEENSLIVAIYLKEGLVLNEEVGKTAEKG
jgi:hypothetical protein